MRIGYLIDTNRGDYDQPLPGRDDAAAAIEAMVEEGVLAEKAGFHSVQVPDRHGRTESYFGSPLNLLMILAHETEKVALGSYCLVNPLYHPMHVAEQCAIIDNLSKGRLYMTWGRGYHSGYLGQFGIPEDKLLGRFLDSVRLIEKALESKGERFDWQSDYHQVRQGLLSPNSYQQPRFPFWGGGQLPAAIARCGTYAESWTCDQFPILPEVWEEQAGAYRAKAREHGKQPFIVLMRDGWLADSFEQAAEEFGTHYVAEMRFYCEQGILAHHPELDTPEKITPESAREHIVMGTAAQCRERLEWYYEELGVNYFTIRFRMVTGPSFEATRDQILRFGEEVVQPLHRKYPAIEHPAIPEVCRW
jgi:alkanesulfonate monooxygenase SsuD/methylene tetrahydromethanopterin reductase-like flavin-dependent oxidoreductase (luciferase family)|tara:strand:+ start:444 stop:1526 length:1083 start_codon:yes stop_codon:yes gene_type:complete